MKLPIPKLGKKKQERQYFLSLILRDEYISAWILQEQDGQLHVAGKSEEALSNSIEQLTDEQWLETIDRVISKAEEVLPPKMVTHKTMFGLKENWVEDDHIKKEYLARLKKVCDSLQLQPVGFLVITEAIAHQIEEQEGAPLTAIMVEIGKQQLTVAYLRTGKVIETRHSIIVGTPAATLDALLKYFTTASVLPSRIIIFDGGHSEQLAQDFIVHQWSKSLPFLHMPQITSLPKGYDVKAVVLGAAAQMGLRISGDLNLQEPRLTTHAAQAETNDEQGAQTATKNLTLAQQFQERLNERLAEETPQTEMSDEQVKTNHGEQTKPATDPIHSDNFGFLEGEDVSTTLAQQMQHDVVPLEDSLQTPYEESSFVAEDRPNQYPSTSSQKAVLPISLPAFLQGLPRNLSNMSRMFSRLLPSSAGRVPRWMYLLPIILILIVGGIIWYITQVTATVDLTLKPKVVEEQGTINFTTSGANDFSSNTVTAQDVSVDLDGNMTTNATGSKDVGTPAKGTVTIYNNSDAGVSLSSGTTITSSNNLAFSLDKDVSIASASGDVFSGTKPGTADVSVTAKDIGTQFNLPSGTTFTVSGQNSSIAAKNGSAFSGGTKKTVTVVSQKDVDKLLSALPSSLEDKALELLKTKVSGDQILLPGIISTDLSNKQFDHKVNDQASNVTLKATVTFHGASYKNQDLEDLGKLLLKDKFTDNSSLSDKGITPTLSNIKSSGEGAINADITLKAGLLPHIDTQQLLSDITGKPVDVAKNMLGNQPQVESSSIVLHPNLPFVPQVLPRFSNHITISIHSDE